MPVKTYWESEGFIYKASGIVTIDEINASAEAFYNLPPATITNYQLFDALEVEELRLNEMELVDVTADDLSMSRKNPFQKIAIIAKEGPVMEKMVKYMKISWSMNTTWEIRIFTNLDSAHKWLAYIEV